MNDELPWLKMLLLVSILLAMFIGPLIAMKVHDAWVGRTGRATSGESGDA